MRMQVSVIVPTLNEVENILELFQYFKGISEGREFEFIVVDGGSKDGTVECLLNHEEIVLICTSAGRAHQLNTGAKYATARWLYFLHADTRPPIDFWTHLEDMDQKGYESGCFRLAFDDPHPLLRFCSWCTRIDWNCFRFGDQSLLVSKELFHRLGGYDNDRYMLEDNDLVVRLTKGGRFSLRPAEVLTSARKYRKHGPVYLQSVYCLLYLADRCGLSQKCLLKLYRYLIRRPSLKANEQAGASGTRLQRIGGSQL
ncbi:MAG: TIGR04283 family arsenosugar biosynthesis glycosyltransferase [Bacteroidota bacterium]